MDADCPSGSSTEQQQGEVCVLSLSVYSSLFPSLTVLHSLNQAGFWGLGKKYNRVQNIKEGQWAKHSTCLLLFNLRLMPLNCRWSKTTSPMANEICVQQFQKRNDAISGWLYEPLPVFRSNGISQTFSMGITMQNPLERIFLKCCSPLRLRKKSESLLHQTLESHQQQNLSSQLWSPPLYNQILAFSYIREKPGTSLCIR